ncbi:MAG TPA: MliC family protein [Syntrophales bacterium]|jgi:membrane-bound inhibitor of C-type lysozyme|nr:MliC family protein [Syntrophales bacterium]
MSGIGIRIVIGALALVLVCGNALAGPGPGRLTVSGGMAVRYACENGDRVLATYYQLSDGSLSFVKVRMPDGKVYTLPQALSASGSRYTDDRELVWWTKGDLAFAEVRDDNGEWTQKYRDCRVTSEGKGAPKAGRHP